MTNNIVHLEAGDFVWEEIPGKGKCLVPVPKTVNADELEKFRAFRNTRGQVIRVVTGFTQDGQQFYTLLNDTWNYRCYSDTARESYQALAELISRARDSSDIKFKEWVKS